MADNAMADNNDQDAIELLEAEHREAENLFKKYDEAKEAGNTDEKYEIARQVCAALLIHMQVEEALFYPAVRVVVNKKELVDEAIIEHRGAKAVINELGFIAADNAMFDTKVNALNEQIQHHINEEEGELFPKVRNTDLDLYKLGKRMTEKKEQLFRQHNMQQSADE
jgi:hypothetical protein